MQQTHRKQSLFSFLEIFIFFFSCSFQGLRYTLKLKLKLRFQTEQIKMSSANTSTQTVLTSLATNAVVFGVFVCGFLVLRLKFKRIYLPKSSYDLVPEEQKPEPLPPGIYQWLWVLLRKKEAFILKQAGLDGYFFIRYLFVILSFTLFGCFFLAILLPVNATGGLDGQGLDLLSIANVSKHNRYYCHVFIAWCFYGLFMFVLYRELVFYNSMRLAVQSSPKYARLLSSRTVLFQTVTDQFLDEQDFTKLFEGVKRVWITRGQKELARKVKQRDQIAFKLEGALHNLLQKAVKAKLKADKKGEIIEPVNEIACYVPTKKRPSHKLKPLFGEKVDTIDWCSEQISKLDEEIKELQSNYKKVKPMNSVFVEFDNQYYAQLAYQSTPHHMPFHFGPKFVGIEPTDVIWPNMRIFWWERIVRATAATLAIIALLILWAFPVAFVGVISNLTYLTNRLHFLRFIYNLPQVLLGLITSLLPTILLAVLMSLLPKFLRTMTRISGATSLQQVEFGTQQSYFAFLVIQVFLVTTISSSATSVVTQIVEEPTSAMGLLATNLPKSSNFYISYLILQGLSISGGALFQISGLILFYILSFILDKTVRKKQIRFTTLSTYAWGTVFPVYTNLAVITMAYAIISPMILPFATVGFLLLYICYLHNITYVFGQSPNFIGGHYPRALFQTMVGVYLGEVCLLGIFAVGKGWGPIVLEIILIVATVLIHINLSAAFDRLTRTIPADAMRPLDGKSATSSYGMMSKKEKRLSESPFMSKEELNDIIDKDTLKTAREQEVPLLIDDADYIIEENTKVNFIKKFFRPDLYSSYKAAKDLLPESYFEVPDELDYDAELHLYDYPDVTAQAPVLWIPKDPMGLSTIEIEKLKDVIHISDEGAIYNEKGKVQWLGTDPPTYEEALNSKTSTIDFEHSQSFDSSI